MDKKYTAEEAAKAVLQKAEEMLKSSKLAKSVHGIPGKNRPEHSRGINETVSVSDDKEAHEKSLQGIKVRRGDNAGAKAAALETHKEMKAMPKPNLTKDESNAASMAQSEVEPSGIEQHASTEKENGNPAWGTEPGCHKLSKFMGRREEKSKAKAAPSAAPMEKATGNEKGVHLESFEVPESENKNHSGVSVAGAITRWKAPKEAKDIHQKKLAELKAMPKPNLTKATGNEKGVHLPANNVQRAAIGMSAAGNEARTGTKHDARQMHGEKLAELKAMPKPKLTKGEE